MAIKQAKFDAQVDEDDVTATCWYQSHTLSAAAGPCDVFLLRYTPSLATQGQRGETQAIVRERIYGLQAAGT